MISLLIALVVIGLCLYLVETLPIDPRIKVVIRVVAVLIIIVYLLRTFGFVDIPIR